MSTPFGSTSDHVDHVTRVERDHLSADAFYRRGVPQAGHADVLLAAGPELREGWSPGVTEDLLAAGTIR